MYTRYFYIAAVFTFFMFYSCNNRDSGKAEIQPEDGYIHDVQEPAWSTITRMEKEALNNIENKTDVRVYQNTTVYADMKIGDFLDVEINEIASLNRNVLGNDIDTKLTPRKGIIYAYSKTGWQLSVVFDNDIFDNRDYYFTNGLRVELVAPFVNHSPLKKILPGLKDAEIDHNGFSIAQNIYTPTNPDTSIILADDHPFSAYLTAGQFRDNYSLKRKLHMRSEFRIGVIGPSSFGQQVQTSIHEIKPVGWQNQVTNDFVIDYSFRIEKGLISNSHIEINAMGQANIGTLYNKVGGGLNLRVGNFMPVFKGPFSVFENKNPRGRVQYWIFVKSQADFIGYDATLQGGIFSKDNIYVVSQSNLSRFVFQSSAGFAFYYNSIGLEYEHFYETPRFRNAYHFGWGRLKAVLAF